MSKAVEERKYKAVHIKVKRISSFKAVTRKTPFLCRSGDPARSAHILVFEGDPETVEQVRERLGRLDATAMLCDDCAAEIEVTLSPKEQTQ